LYRSTITASSAGGVVAVTAGTVEPLVVDDTADESPVVDVARGISSLLLEQPATISTVAAASPRLR